MDWREKNRQKVRDFEARTREGQRDREAKRHNRKMERLASKGGSGCVVLFICLVVPSALFLHFV